MLLTAMSRSLVALTLIAAAAPVLAEPVAYRIDPTHTFPSFEVSHLGYSIQRGRFNQTSGKVILDLAARSGSVYVSIDAASVDTGLEAVMKHLRSSEFFNVDWYPALIYKSSRLVFDGDRLAQVEGELTMTGVTRPVTLTVDHFHCAPNPLTRKDTCGANATASLRRSDFDMTTFLPMIGDDVKIAIQVEAIKD